MILGVSALVDVLIFSILTNFAIEALSSFGLRFLIAIPKADEKYDEEVHFLLGTMANKIQVAVTTNRKKGDRLLDSVTLMRSRVTRYIVDPAFLPKEDGISQSWTYELNSEASFTLTVVMIQPGESVASFLAYPLSVWSKSYFWGIYWQNPTFHIVTLEETQLNITMTVYASKNFTHNINNKTYKSGSVEPFTMETRSSFMFSFCDYANSTDYLKEMIITVTSAEPIGIISGNCKARWTVHTLGCPAGEQLADSALEMILPFHMAATEFIFWIDFPGDNTLNVIAKIGTEIIVKLADKVSEYTLTEEYSKLILLKPGVLSASSPVLVIQEVSLHCEFNKFSDLSGDTSQVTLLPTSLFYVFYMWRAPVLNLRNKVNIVVENYYINSTVLDDLPLSKKIEWSAAGPTYSVAMFVVTTGSHTIRSDVNRKFGCYITAINAQMGLAHTAGFSSCKHKGAGTDEDECVGGTDEEAYTPGLKGVELSYSGIGSWGHWEKWTCTAEGVQIRTRTCQNNLMCKGMFDDISNDPCKGSAGPQISDSNAVLLICVWMLCSDVNL